MIKDGLNAHHENFLLPTIYSMYLSKYLFAGYKCTCQVVMMPASHDKLGYSKILKF